MSSSGGESANSPFMTTTHIQYQIEARMTPERKASPPKTYILSAIIAIGGSGVLSTTTTGTMLTNTLGDGSANGSSCLRSIVGEGIREYMLGMLVDGHFDGRGSVRQLGEPELVL